MPRTPSEREAAVAALGFDEIGRSTEGRPIVARRFGGPGAPLLVMGGIHGDEPASVDALLDLLARLPGAPVAAPFWLVPAANPDGLWAGRKNSARDVDLNRNFPARSFRTDHAPGYFPGLAPLSEPETRAVAELIAREDPCGAVAVHAPFACVNYDGPAAAWAEAVSRACGWPARGDIGYPTPGSFGSWLGLDEGLPVLTLELPPGPLGGFREQAAAALEAALGAPPARNVGSR
ncbi:MAG TPA: M14 family zinc carboxypeptidase [Polyangia bacterium]|nr:M14 family zinc carboxypeptidase [Polyangia bacterium]